MKKILTACILIFVSCTMMSGCTRARADDRQENTASSTEEKTRDDIKYEIIRDKNDLPELAIAVMNSYKTVRGYHIYEAKDEFAYLIINSGQKKTGGYRIKVADIKEIDGMLKVIVEETSPSPDAMVTQAFTYPQAVVKLTAVPSRLKVENTKGQELLPVK